MKTRLFLFAIILAAVSPLYARTLDLENEKSQLDIIDAETIYFYNNLNSFSAGYTNFLQWRKGLFNQNHFFGGPLYKVSDIGFLTVAAGFTIVNQSIADTYSPYGDQKASANREALAFGLLTPYGHFRAGFYAYNMEVKPEYDPYHKYKGRSQKQWEPHYFVSYSGGMIGVFDSDTTFSDLFQKLSAGVQYLGRLRTAPLFAQKMNIGRESDKTKQYGISQDFYLFEAGKYSYARNVSLFCSRKTRGGDNDGTILQAEAIGVIPYVYAGVWRNGKYGWGYGFGLGVWQDKRHPGDGVTFYLSGKWNEAVPDPVFGRIEGLSVTFSFKVGL